MSAPDFNLVETAKQAVRDKGYGAHEFDVWDLHSPQDGVTAVLGDIKGAGKSFSCLFDAAGQLTDLTIGVVE